MGNITIRNVTDLTDFSAVIRAGLYLAGQVEEAKEGGYQFDTKSTFSGTVIKVSAVTEKEPTGMTVPESSM